MTLVFQSCEETQSPIYDGSQTLAYFDGTSATLEVEINSTGTITVPVGVSTLSSSDRTITLSASSTSTATAGQYSFNSSVTIPANSYTGSFDVTGIDDELETSGVSLTLQIDGVDGGVGSPRTYGIRIVEICPIEATFAVGDYLLETISGGVGAAGFAPAMGDGIVVTLEAGSSSTERKFNVKFYPSFGFANPPVDVSFSLSCEDIVFGSLSGNSGVGCGGSIAFASSTNLGAYSTADDSIITVIYIEDSEEICGSSAEGSIRLTKQ